jgi:hypothetical protein
VATLIPANDGNITAGLDVQSENPPGIFAVIHHLFKSQPTTNQLIKIPSGTASPSAATPGDILLLK